MLAAFDLAVELFNEDVNRVLLAFDLRLWLGLFLLEDQAGVFEYLAGLLLIQEEVAILQLPETLVVVELVDLGNVVFDGRLIYAPDET